MTKSEFEELQVKLKSSGMTLMSFLKVEGVAYTTYRNWRKKMKEESCPMPIAPIELRNGGGLQETAPAFSGADLPGVTLAFPNGVRAHFGSGSESILMDVLTRSMSHVLPQ